MSPSLASRLCILCLLALLPVACSDSDEDAASPSQNQDTQDTGDQDAGDQDADDQDADDQDADDQDAAPPDPTPGFAASCVYTNPFSRSPECKAYMGTGWDEAAARADCSNVFGAVGELTPNGVCSFEAELGRCLVEEATGKDYTLVISGDEPSGCPPAVTACEVFVSGTFTPSPVCADDDTPVDPTQGGVFTQPFLDCRPPLEGEPPGLTDGQICTQIAIQGCTEEGRRFDDYADCSVVYTQRPYYAFDFAEPFADSSARLNDPDFAADLAWSREQVAASACVCCHATESTPAGASGWHIDDALWVDTVPNAGLAMLAGWVDSTSFGAFPPEQNNGFDRHTTGLPTTDVPRMRAFLESLLLDRGITREQAQVDYAAFGGPLYTQSIFEPAACANGEGVDGAGVLTWTGGAARYVYVLEADAANPGVPPNLDTPMGTRWRLDVDREGTPVESGLLFGATPAGTAQRVPATEPPAALTPGQTYYLYVLRDIGIPVTRCLFTAQAP